MRNKGHRGTKRVATTLLAVALLAPVASAQTVGANSFPGTPGAIAFSSTRDGAANFNIYRMNADGFGQTKLTDTPGVSFSPNWSADGKKIAFQSNRAAPDGSTDYDVWRARATDGANPKNLTNAPGNDTDPAWQPLS